MSFICSSGSSNWLTGGCRTWGRVFDLGRLMGVWLAQNVAGGGAFAIALQVHTPEKHGRFGLDHVRFDVAPSSLEAFEVRVMQPDAAITYSSLNPDTCTLFG